MVAPDIVIYREPEPDDCINSNTHLVDANVCTLSDLRKQYSTLPILQPPFPQSGQ